MPRSHDHAVNRSVLILGATSSVARAIATEFARLGFAVGLAGRRPEALTALAGDLRIRYAAACHVLPFDATAFDDHAAFVQQAAAAFGELPEGVVACFGQMVETPDARQDFAPVRRMVEANLAGTASILDAFAAAFEPRRRGFLAAITSVAGDRGRKGNYLYGASKAGLSVFLQGLRHRLHPAGIDVTDIRPGFMDTPMTYGRKLPAPLVASLEDAAAAAVRGVLAGRPVVYVPWFWRYVMFLVRNMPGFIFNRMDF